MRHVASRKGKSGSRSKFPTEVRAFNKDTKQVGTGRDGTRGAEPAIADAVGRGLLSHPGGLSMPNVLKTLMLASSALVLAAGTSLAQTSPPSPTSPSRTMSPDTSPGPTSPSGTLPGS